MFPSFLSPSLLRWQITFERIENPDKKTHAEDECTGSLAHNESATSSTIECDTSPPHAAVLLSYSQLSHA